MARGGKNDQINIEDRRAKALELRKGGSSYRAIATKLGVDVKTAYGDVDAALKSLVSMNTSNAEELRTIELERLDAMLLSISDQLKAGHLGAIDRALRISERRSKLQGLDSPVQVENITPESKLIDAIRNREAWATYETVVSIYDGDTSLAERLFQQAGVPIER